MIDDLQVAMATWSDLQWIIIRSGIGGERCSLCLGRGQLVADVVVGL